MAVMLNMTDYSDGFNFPRILSPYFPLHNQSVAPAISAATLWHVSCELFCRQNIRTIVFSAYVRSILTQARKMTGREKPAHMVEGLKQRLDSIKQQVQDQFYLPANSLQPTIMG